MDRKPDGAGRPLDFIRQIVTDDVEAGRNDARVVTRFPPEPNGYLHIGHAKSICLNFGVASEFGGHCTLRYDDTNPLKESEEYAQSIEADVRWLGFDPGAHIRHASDYFEQLYTWAETLIDKGKAYVCSLNAEEVRAHRGTLTEPGRASPWRDRSVEENLDLFRRMRAGEFADGEHTLRARIDMASPNLNMRDPTLYRIRHAHHYRRGDSWCIYPMYDYTQCLSDAIEGVTHSLCTLEFEDHRPLYDWVIEQVAPPHRPRQIEFSRLNLDYTVMSKRLLNRLVSEQHVGGWDDPRIPTLQGLRRRGYTPASIRDFCDRIGITKKDNTIEMAVLENCVREDLERHAPRALCVLRPLKVVIDNYPDTGDDDELEAPNHPADPAMGSRRVPFSREIYIERDDFMENPPSKYFRLKPGGEVRLRFAYIVRCVRVEKDPATGEITEIGCTYEPASRGGNAPDGRKIKGTIHWVSAAHALVAQVRLYDRLFTEADPRITRDSELGDTLNPESLTVIDDARVEPSLGDTTPETHFQFERLGYFVADRHDYRPDRPVFNRTVTLRDTWAKRTP